MTSKVCLSEQTQLKLIAAEDKAKQQVSDATAAVRKEAQDRIAELEKLVHEKEVSMHPQSNSGVDSMHAWMSNVIVE